MNTNVMISSMTVLIIVFGFLLNFDPMSILYGFGCGAFVAAVLGVKINKLN